MTSTPEDETTTAPEEGAAAEASVHVDPSLVDAHDLALAALREITAASSIGDPAEYRVEGENVISLRFENRLAGYPGWFWTVTLAKVDDSDPTVLEVELLPGTGALVAPEWVPWAVRLAEYHAAQEAVAEAGADDEESEDSDGLDDVDDLDASDFDDDGSPILHAGDVDGVDIDELDDSADEDDSDEDDDSDDDDSDDSDDSDDDSDDENDSDDDEDADDDSDDDDSDDEDDSNDDDSDEDDSDEDDSDEDDDTDDSDDSDEDDDSDDDDSDDSDDSDDEDDRS